VVLITVKSRRRAQHVEKRWTVLNLENGARIGLKNVLYLTDFSDSSKAALPIVRGIASSYGATVHALYVVLPDPYANMSAEMAPGLAEAQEEAAQARMRRVESQLSGVVVRRYLARDTAVWPAVEEAVAKHRIDLIVLGTSGRTGGSKWLLGSVAEEIFRRSSVPVITVGPFVRSESRSDGRFGRVLFATDFSPESRAATPYAISLAEENDAKLILLHVAASPGESKKNIKGRLSIAEVMHLLDGLVPSEAALWCRPETVVEYGQPAERILEAARERGADLIVLGVRETRHLLAATHLEGSTAHKIVASAICPVLTVHGERKRENSKGA
jgi:nucleotide-binding universal stress UspA family protein